jgi:hypothetical protein
MIVNKFSFFLAFFLFCLCGYADERNFVNKRKILFLALFSVCVYEKKLVMNGKWENKLKKGKNLLCFFV